MLSLSHNADKDAQPSAIKVRNFSAAADSIKEALYQD
jgi:hypothetical protein